MTEFHLKKLVQFTSGTPDDFQEKKVFPGESSTIVTPAQAKVAALMYDKIWVPPRSYQPDFGFDFGDDQPPDELMFCTEDDISVLNDVGVRTIFVPDASYVAQRRVDAIHTISQKYERRSKFHYTLICGGDLQKYEERNPSIAYRLVVKNVQVPVNASLTWKQVCEFRKDKESREKLRWMNQWINNDLSNKSEEQVKEALEIRLSDYQEALKKHGAITNNGILASLFTGLAGFAAKPDQSGLILAFTVIGGAAIALQKKHIDDRAELKKPGLREVAWLHQLHQKPLMSRFRDWIYGSY